MELTQAAQRLPPHLSPGALLLGGLTDDRESRERAISRLNLASLTT